ncbi:unnamed protein product [Caretta caretta]
MTNNSELKKYQYTELILFSNTTGDHLYIGEGLSPSPEKLKMARLLTYNYFVSDWDETFYKHIGSKRKTKGQGRPIARRREGGDKRKHGFSPRKLVVIGRLT